MQNAFPSLHLVKYSKCVEIKKAEGQRQSCYWTRTASSLCTIEYISIWECVCVWIKKPGEQEKVQFESFALNTFSSHFILIFSKPALFQPSDSFINMYVADIQLQDLHISIVSTSGRKNSGGHMKSIAIRHRNEHSSRSLYIRLQFRSDIYEVGLCMVFAFVYVFLRTREENWELWYLHIRRKVGIGGWMRRDGCSL